MSGSACSELLSHTDTGSPSAAISALNRLCSILEEAERQYQELVGDPHISPGHRSQYAIGQITWHVDQEEALCQSIHEHWTSNAEASLQKRVAGMRFLFSSLTAWHQPSRLEDILGSLKLWATEDEDKRQTRGDEQADPEHGILKEAQRAYAAGLLAIGLSDDEICEEAVRDGVISKLARWLNRAVLGSSMPASQRPAPSQLPSSPFASELDMEVVELPADPQPRAVHPVGGMSYIPADGAAAPAVSAACDHPWSGVAPDEGQTSADALLLASLELEPASSDLAASSAARQEREDAVLQRAAEVDRLRLLRMRSTVQCCACMGEYQECLAPLLTQGIVEVVLRLLADWRLQPVELLDVLRLLCSLLAHRRIAEQIVDRGGVQLLLSLPHSHHTRGFLSMAMFCLASIPQVLERLCALPSPVPEQLVSTALSFLTSGFDPARRNAAQFLNIALKVRCILAEFDRQGGLQRLLNVLRASLLLLKGPQAADARMDKQVGYHATAVLRQYCWTHVVILANVLQRRLPAGSPSTKQGAVSHVRPVNTCAEAVEEALAAVQAVHAPAGADAELLPWVQPFLQADGCQMMLAFVEISPREKYFMEMAMHALQVLRVATLEAAAQAAVAQAAVQGQTGVEVLLGAVGSTAATGESEVAHAALLVVCNLVQPPLPVREPDVGASSEQDAGKAHPAMCTLAPAARAAVREAGGIRQLIGLLTPRWPSPGGPDLRGVAAYCLLGLAQEPVLCRILARLQIARLLAELIHEPSGGVSWRRASCDAGASLPASSAGPHEVFSKTALQLISLTTAGIGAGQAGAAADAPGPALHRLEREAIAASTEISYPQSELMLLIHEHLRASGLHAAAKALKAEAVLDTRPAAGTAQRDLMQAINEAGSQEPDGKSAAGSEHHGIKAAAGAPSIHKRTLTVSPALLQSLSIDRADNSSRGEPDISPPAGAHQPAGEDRQASSVAGKAADSFIAPPGSYTKKRLLDSAAARTDMLPASAQPVKRARCNQGVQAMLQPACTPSAPDMPLAQGTSALRRKPGRRQLLQGLPKRITPAQPAFKTPKPPAKKRQELPPSKASAHLAVASPPERTAARPAARPDTQAEQSRLSSIVMQYLRHQHRHACLQAPVPIATLPPLSLLAPSSIPEAKRTLDAPSNAGARLRQRQVSAPFGGCGGRRQERHQQFGRFRQMRTLKDADAGLLRACAFVQGDACLAVGCHAGSMQVLNVQSGEVISASDTPQGSPINQIRVWEEASCSRILSSTRSDVRLWHGTGLASYQEIPGMRHAIFHPNGQHLAAVASAGRQACIWDVTRADGPPWTLESPASASGGAAFSSRLPRETVCFNAGGDLLLHGPLLWDWRSPRAVHCFDVFSDTPGSGSFHPYGLEVILNSEVWDLRMLRLLRSVPCLDGTVLSWAGTGDAAFATLRRGSDDLHSSAHTRRSRHPLHTAFRTVDASGYGEIATVGMDGRLVLDLASEPSDNLVAVATVEPHELASSSVRVYCVGAQHAKDDPDDDEGMSDGDKGDESDEDEEDPSPWVGISAELASLNTPGGGAHEQADQEAESESYSEAASQGEDDDDIADEAHDDDEEEDGSYGSIGRGSMQEEVDSDPSSNSTDDNASDDEDSAPDEDYVAESIQSDDDMDESE